MVNIAEFNEKYLENWIYDGAELSLTKGYDIKNLAKLYARLGDAFMGFIDNKLVGIGGIYPIVPGMGQAWLFLNKLPDHIAYAFVSIKEYLKLIAKKNNYKKVQIYCVKGNPKITNLAEHLGFKKVTELSLYEIGE